MFNINGIDNQFCWVSVLTRKKIGFLKPLGSGAATTGLTPGPGAYPRQRGEALAQPIEGYMRCLLLGTLKVFSSVSASGLNMPTA
jgi:hypothetical protein